MAFKIEYAKTMAEKILKYMVQYMFNTTSRDMCGDDPWWSHLAWSCLDYDLLPPQGFFLLFFVDATVVHTMQAGNERSKSFKIHRLASTEALNQPQNDLDDDEEPIRWSTDSAFFFFFNEIDSPIMSSCPIHLNMSQTSEIGIWLACIVLPWYCAILSCKLIRWKVEDIA